ncbi:NAD(P)/FAD-dependent oxidoreductase [Cecembia lonarensis]|uniref:Rhodocoxin reductase n=1 Tax=Cecembia lonarensis (strain CCUG 58316 / KCTC 22772 / LW9) TaxID=1225176 RepID=K1L303_CECL9|nr:FAD/NAD(P)-binding oxidoreductase [Cecembia lonarensis]EKB49186.1 Rhodocoxin reductase [Cecembia lonarensis LW9]
MSKRKIVIIGNGISGITCARNIRKNDEQADILVISGETKYFYSRTALMYIYMGHMKFEHTKPYEDWFWEKNRIDLLQAWIELVDFQQKKLICHNGDTIHYDHLILATGSKPAILDWPGKQLNGVQGLYSYQDLELMAEKTKGIKSAVVVGGGLIGIEMAEMLASRKIHVTFIVRESNFWDNVLPKEEAMLINKHIREHGIDLRLSTELDEILDDGKGNVKAIRTKNGDTVSCEFVGITIGVIPNIDFLRDTDLELGKGILVDTYFRTNLANVYAIGDCAEFRDSIGENRKKIEQVWYTGRMHGESLAHNLSSARVMPYQPGVWFNSAKFFDIEYQTYGNVPPQIEEDSETFYWEDKSGKVAIRFNYLKHSECFQGVNAFGWRLRHEFFDRAISEKWTIDRVIGQLDKSSFNPEFYKPYHRLVLDAYNKTRGKAVKFRKTSFFHKLIGSRA